MDFTSKNFCFKTLPCAPPPFLPYSGSSTIPKSTCLNTDELNPHEAGSPVGWIEPEIA